VRHGRNNIKYFPGLSPKLCRVFCIRAAAGWYRDRGREINESGSNGQMKMLPNSAPSGPGMARPSMMHLPCLALIFPKKAAMRDWERLRGVIRAAA
jgi:hypothetical protein